MQKIGVSLRVIHFELILLGIGFYTVFIIKSELNG